MPQDSEIGADLTRDLLSAFPRDPDSGNYKLLQVAGHEFDGTVDDIDAIDRASTVQHADTVDQLEELGKLVDLPPREGEKREKYRSRIISEYQLATCEGTIEDVFNSLAVVLGINREEVQYQTFDEPKTVGIAIPKSSLDEIELTDSELTDIINQLVSAAARVEAQTRGTLEYITPETYQDIQDGNDDWYNYPGYDGLDSNGEPKENESAGTFAGTLT